MHVKSARQLAASPTTKKQTYAQHAHANTSNMVIHNLGEFGSEQQSTNN